MVLFDTQQSVVTIHFQFKRAVPDISCCSSTTGLWVNDKIILGIPWTPYCSVIWSVPLSEKRRMAGDAHEGSTGGVSTVDSCRLRLLHVDRLAESRDSRHWPRNMRVSGAQSHDWQRCRFRSSIHLWKEKGRRDIYTRHKACLSGFFASRDKKANAFPGQKQELDSEFAPLFSHHKTNGRKKKMECGKSEDINNDPEVSRCLNTPTITLDNSCHTQYI